MDDKLKDFIQNHQADFNDATPPTSLWDRVQSDLEEADDEIDPLERFVTLHREEFDDATPPPRLLAKVLPPATRQLVPHSVGTAPPKLTVSHRRRRTLLYLTGIAASLLLMLTAYRFGNRAGYRAGQEETVAQQLQRINPELAEAERFYQQRIDLEFSKVQQVNDDPALRRDLREIDAATRELRAQLLEVPESQRHVLVNELIETYRTKLDILLRIQQHIPHNNPGAPAARPNIPPHES